MTKPKQKCIVLIDGSNFYFKLKDLGLKNLLDFDFTGFIKFLSKNGVVIKTVYFVGKVKNDGTEKIKKMQASQQKLFSHLKNHHVQYSLGYLMKSGGKIHEKGVDVAIAVELLTATYEKQCDKIILISSDTDLLPAILKAKQKSMKVEYIGFAHKPSIALVSQCSSSKLLDFGDLEMFVKSKK